MGEDEVKVEGKRRRRRREENLCCCVRCCCTVEGWIRLITWTKIVLFGIINLAALLNLATVDPMRPTWMKDAYANALQRWTMFALWALLTLPTPLILLSVVQLVKFLPKLPGVDWKYGGAHQLLVVFGASFLVLLVGTTMCIILLKGLNQKSVGKLKVWIVYAIICMTLTVLEAAAGIVLDHQGIHFDPHRLIIRVMVSMTFQGCVLGTVLKFKNKLEDLEKCSNVGVEQLVAGTTEGAQVLTKE